ncbi:MAG: DUF3500 domain-containing protein [Janthinobacterium lividum]
MRTSTLFASTTALLALMAFKQDAAHTSLPAAYPVRSSAMGKGVRAIKGTQDVVAVVAAANAFLATLSTTQQTTAVVAYNATNVVKWSNLPCGAQCREGLEFANLTTAQITAALAVVQAATGTVANDGFDETQQIRAADDNLSAASSSGGGGGGGGGYGSGLYFIAFVGTPSATGTWMLQYGGHHLATNITFGAGAVTGATPKFEGVEPLTFTGTGNTTTVVPAGTFTPMGNEAATMVALLGGLTTAHKATAKLTQTFSDVLLGPGQDGKFPTTKVGVKCSDLTAAEQALVIAAMKPWVQDADDATAANLMTTYQAQLADTYISYAGTGLFTTNTDYARIDGPNVWIEFVAQTGVVYNTQTHFHSIWRDHARDYGGNFYGSFTTTLGTKAAAAVQVFSVYPNPTEAHTLNIRLASTATAATCTLRNTLGQQVASQQFSGDGTTLSTAGLAAGAYILSVQTAGQNPVTQRVILK